MAWIESHQALRDHPKVRHLARLLGVDYDSALGKLHRFWYWCTDYAEDGDLRKYGLEIISDSLGYDANHLRTARLVDADPYLRVHDWWEWSGRYWQSKYKNQPEKWHRIKSLYLVGSNMVVSTGHLPTDLPTHLPTNQDIAPLALAPRGAFDQLWIKYPNKDGKKAAERHFKGSVKTMIDWLDIQRALDNYLQSDNVKRGFIKNGSTWFNNWRDWVDFKGVPGGQHATDNRSGAHQGAQPIAGKYDRVLAERQAKLEQRIRERKEPGAVHRDVPDGSRDPDHLGQLPEVRKGVEQRDR